MAPLPPASTACSMAATSCSDGILFYFSLFPELAMAMIKILLELTTNCMQNDFVCICLKAICCQGTRIYSRPVSEVPGHMRLKRKVT